MAKKNLEENFSEEDIIVEMTDDEGNIFYYSEEMIIPVGDENFALLVAIPNEDEEEHIHDEDCDCGCGDDEVIIAKIITDENGEEIYVEPTDEEFDRVSRAYDELMMGEE